MKTFYLALASLATLNIFASEASKPKEFTVKPQQWVLLKGQSFNSYIGSRSNESEKDKLARQKDEQFFLDARSKTIPPLLGLQFVQRDANDTHADINIVCRNDSNNNRVIIRSRIERTEWHINDVLPLVVSYHIDNEQLKAQGKR